MVLKSANLVSGKFVVVSYKLGFGKIYDLLNGNINVQMFYIECEESVVGVNV